MTTICFRDGVLAADTMMSYGSVGHAMPGLKLFYAGRFAVGVCGDCRIMPVIEDWFENDMPPEGFDKLWNDDFDALAMDDQGRLFTLLAYKLQFLPHDFFSIGSGSLSALGAMAMGADAATAVQVASRYDHNTNDITEEITLADLQAYIAERFDD